jgi:hypothetical protein
MRPVGNSRKNKRKIHETEEHPKRVTENVCVTHIPGETYSSGGSQSSVRPDQLRLLDDSVTTNLSQSAISPPTSRSTNDIPDVVGVPASQTFPGIGFQDPERLGVTCRQSEIDTEIEVISFVLV